MNQYLPTAVPALEGERQSYVTAPAAGRIVLPEGYYLEHFCDFVGKVQRTYFDFLDENEKAFVVGFQELPEAERRLFARLANRKGVVFVISALSYPEIPALGAAVTSLLATGFLRKPDESDLTACLAKLKKEQLFVLLKEGPSAAGVKAAWSKERLLKEALTCISFAWFSASSIYADIIMQQYDDVLAYLYFLAFGDTGSDLSLYTLRDLGIRQANNRPKEFTARFASAKEARSEYFYRVLYSEVRDLGDTEISPHLADSQTWHEPVGAGALHAREKVIWELSQKLAASGSFKDAIKLLSLESSSRIVEKRIRLLYSYGTLGQAEAELKAILDNPTCIDLLLFAEDFSARKLGSSRMSAVTRALKEAKTIKLNGRYRGQPERGAKDYFMSLGHRAYRTENYLWLSLFGIFFWNELFEDESAAIHSEFDYTPADLIQRTFYQSKKQQIEQKIAYLLDSTQAIAHLRSVIARRFGTVNGIFKWHESLAPMLTDFLEACCANRLDVSPILLRIAQDFQNNKKGFPDLMLIEQGKPKFIEVKTAGDKLQPAQLRQLHVLSQVGFATEVLKIEWEYDKDQTYVVVDVETTGGFADTHRVTEIGALKVRNGCVIDRLSTLVNPQRRIPNNIVALTGISNEMVSSAPPFAAIANTLLDFMGDAIFVAHNAPFDYGFISTEFRRLGIPFRSPVLCTCTGMRRSYPGLDSYSLKNLCREFRIRLQNHHRALCDAEATAELLLMVLRRSP